MSKFGWIGAIGMGLAGLSFSCLLFGAAAYFVGEMNAPLRQPEPIRIVVTSEWTPAPTLVQAFSTSQSPQLAVPTAIPVAAVTEIPTQPPAEAGYDLTGVHSAGYYLVGVDIAPGRWRSPSGVGSCSWSTYGQNNSVNDIGIAPGVVAFVNAEDYAVSLRYCDGWQYLGN